MILPDSLEFSGRLRVPLLRIDGKLYYPHRCLEKMLQFRKWRLIQRSPDEVVVGYKGYQIHLSNYYFGLVLSEWYDRWTKAYIPPDGVGGKTVLDVGAGCLPRGHIVLGENKDISEYFEGDSVLSESGKSVVSEIFKRQYSGLLYKIKAHGALPFSVTPEHPILVGENHLSYSRKLYRNTARRVVDRLVWKKASDLSPLVGHRGRGDCLVFPKLVEEAECPKFALEYNRSPPTRYGRVTLEITGDFAELLGLYVAEGNSQNVVEINLGLQERDLADKSVKLIQSTLPYKAKIRERAIQSSMIVSFGGTALARFLREEFGSKATTKKIPDWMLLAPKRILARFLFGLWEGDGHFHTTTKGGYPVFVLSFKTASQLLALQVQKALSKFDIMSILGLTRRGGSRSAIRGRQFVQHDVYDVKVSGYYESLKTVFGVTPARKSARITRRYFEDESHFYLPVRRVETSHFSGDVYNLGTTSGTYLVSNVVVHNCGETALLFFTHGASQVICVEPNHDAANLLRKNVRLNGWNAEVIERPFSPDMLNQLKSDLAKLDCEGAEEALLSLDSLPVAVILEAHGHELSRRLKEEFGFRAVLVGKETEVLAKY